MSGIKQKVCRCTLVGIATAILLGATGCKDENIGAGTEFLTGAYKIKSVLEIKSSGDTVTLECFVDGDGDGEGLLSYAEGVYDVGINGDQIFVKVNDGLTVALTGITGHFVIPDSMMAGAKNIADLSAYGFTVADNKIVGYSKNADTYSVSSQYSTSTTEFDSKSYSTSRDVTPVALVGLLSEQQDTVSTGSALVTAENEEVPEEEERGAEERERIEKLESFYNNFSSGVQIANQIFSIGDTCNPATYYFDEIPEGITQKKEYSRDERITVDYVSYLSKEGKTVFSVVGGYVRSIYTTCPFTWCGINSTMSKEELEAYIGDDLSDKEKEETGFSIPFKGLEYTDKKGKQYYFEISDLTAELTLDGDAISSLYVRRTLDFENYSS